MIFYPPQNIATREFNRPSVFLAGSIESGYAENWQDENAEILDSWGWNVLIMTDLEHLHLVHETLAAGFKLPRRGGYTYYQCHCLSGHLEVCEHETIPVYVKSADRINNFINTLYPVLKEHYIEIQFIDYGSRRIVFNNNTNMVKFITLDWLRHPHNDLLFHYPDIDPNGFTVEDLD